MKRFLQLHLLTHFPPSNPNRDDLGRPKTAVMGGTQRLRISSQSLKRAWRTSSVFEDALMGHLGTRSKLTVQKLVFEPLVAAGIPKADAEAWSQDCLNAFRKGGTKAESEGEGEKKPRPEKKTKKGKGDDYVDLTFSQLIHLGPAELASLETLVARMAERKGGPTSEELQILTSAHGAVDIALFGRMLAEQPSHTLEAAAQVAHAIAVHRCQVEDDYFSAVDDLNDGQADRGSAHLGETGFGSAVHYLYLCVDRDLLVQNLQGDLELANRAIQALLEAAATVSPGGKQKSFAHATRASFVLAELGDQQPRSLSLAFLKDIKGEDVMGKSITALQGVAKSMDQAYGPCSDERAHFDVLQGEGSLKELKAFVVQD